MNEGSPRGRGHWRGAVLALALAVLGLALAAAAALLGGWDALQALVPALVFWGGLSTGSLALLLVHRLTGGAWGEELRRPLLAAAAALPLVALLAAPLLLGLVDSQTDIYPWATEARAGGTAHAHWYLNLPAFTVRTLAILVLWVVIAWSLGAYAPRSTSSPGIGVSAFALVLMVLSMTVIAVDWVMSLEPKWYSAVFGLLVSASQTLSAMALAALWLGLHPRRAALRASAGNPPHLSTDAGNLLLALLLLWGYLVLMQFVTVWIANLPDEIRWFVPRLQTGWRWLGLAWLVLVPGLSLPLLLSRRTKTRPGTLALAAGLVLLGAGLYALWLTLPTLRPAGPRFTLLDLAVLAGTGALWLGAFVLHLSLSWALSRPATVTRRDRAVARPLDVRHPLGVPAVRDDVAWTGTASPVAASRAAQSAGTGASSTAPGGGSRGLEQEPSGIAAGTVVRVVAGIAAMLILAATVLLPWRHQEGANPRPPEAGPELLASPVANLADYRAAQHAQLQDWGWVNREQGIAQIPVDRAIEMLIGHTRSSTSPQEARQ